MREKMPCQQSGPNHPSEVFEAAEKIGYLCQAIEKPRKGVGQCLRHLVLRKATSEQWHGKCLAGPFVERGVRLIAYHCLELVVTRPNLVDILILDCNPLPEQATILSKKNFSWISVILNSAMGALRLHCH